MGSHRETFREKFLKASRTTGNLQNPLAVFTNEEVVMLVTLHLVMRRDASQLNLLNPISFYQFLEHPIDCRQSKAGRLDRGSPEKLLWSHGSIQGVQHSKNRSLLSGLELHGVMLPEKK